MKLAVSSLKCNSAFQVDDFTGKNLSGGPKPRRWNLRGKAFRTALAEHLIMLYK
jgi:hypothetical protein